MRCRRMLTPAVSSFSAAAALSIVSLGAAACASSRETRERDCVAFTKRARPSWEAGDVLPPGRPPSQRVRAYWLGREFDGHRAVVSIFERAFAARQRFYKTYYETASAGCSSGAVASGDTPPPAGELIVTSEPLASETARMTLRVANGRNRVGSRGPRWPRFRVQLVDRSPATLIPIRGVALGGVRGFLVIVNHNLVTVSGRSFTTPEARKLARRLALIGP